MKFGANLGDQESRQEHAHTYFRDRLTRRTVEEVELTCQHTVEYGQDDAQTSLQADSAKSLEDIVR
jgi:tRNA A37 methylthiotransferase MiaB